MGGSNYSEHPKTLRAAFRTTSGQLPGIPPKTPQILRGKYEGVFWADLIEGFGEARTSDEGDTRVRGLHGTTGRNRAFVGILGKRTLGPPEGKTARDSGGGKMTAGLRAAYIPSAIAISRSANCRSVLACC